LNVELARQLRGVRFHLVAMPVALRTAEAFGTHWMLQPYIAVRTKAGEEVFGGRRWCGLCGGVIGAGRVRRRRVCGR
jgi:hypothetical protein